MSQPRPIPPKPDRKTAPDSEAALQKRIITSLERRNIFVNRVNAGTFEREGRMITGARKGHSDLCGCLPPTGRAFYIEVKKPNAKPTTAQAAFLEQRRLDGAIVGIATNVREALLLLGLEPTKAEAKQ